jgi:hypothetical protein
VEPTFVDLSIEPITIDSMVSISNFSNHHRWICASKVHLAASALEAGTSFGPIIRSKS